MSHPTPPAESPSGVRRGKPSAAGMYDYFIGGVHHTEADRAAAERVLRIAPETKSAAEDNRRFLRRAVTYLARQGIDQYLDLGSGFPVGGQVHEIAGEIIPDPHVVYVDRDPMVVEQSRELLSDHPNATVITGDLRRPWDILDDPEVHQLIDWSRPVAVQLVAVLHFISDLDDPREIIATFRDHMSVGSHLVISHGTGGINPDTTDEAIEEWRNSRSSITLRSPGEIDEFFAGFEMVGPGLVTITEWGTPAPSSADQGTMLCGLGKLV